MRLLSIIGEERDVPPEMLLARSRCRTEIAEARRLAMYLAHVGLGCSIAAVSRLFQRNWSTVSLACRAIEDQRDDHDLDCALDRLEAKLRAANENKLSPKELRHAG